MNLFQQKNWILMKELIKTDFKLRYQGSAIGYLWSILKPFMMFTIMYLVFIRFLRLGGDVPHFAVALLLANVIWSFFSEATSMGMVSIVSRGDLIRKLNFSKEIIVLSAVAGAGINFLINLAVVFVFALINGVGISWQVILVIPIFLELGLFASGLAFLLSTIFVRFRDSLQIWEVVLQAGLYATPIIYPISFVANQNELAAKIMMMNPMAQMIQDTRYLLIDTANTTVWQLVTNPFLILIPYCLPILIFIFGYGIFKKNAKKFAEIL
ncbi:ABC transporter permease [Streptococcus sp. NLN64]|uniref:ABC transporter permease n=1 Tax=Streptococcus sp. NLN64 TaxID=2822799 RepID=UPI0018C92355|nr:ABC transporter permease [Streptococcus sp. NLN64]MBG9366679.1 ABC transporter permease [Streptococcus sp. NLN64]